jgi:predicted phosphoribosyltransferase
MILHQSFTIRNRKEAGRMLGEKLMWLKNSEASVVGVPYGGAVIGYHLAKILSLSFDVIACKSIPHPADPRKTIGSVSTDQVVIHDEGYDIPRDYIYHQIVRSQRALKAQQAFYRSGKPDELTIENEEVIVVGDILRSADSLIALIRTLRNQKPKKILVAASMVTPDALRQLASEIDEVVFLFVEDTFQPRTLYEEKTIVHDEDIRDLVLRSFPN